MLIQAITFYLFAAVILVSAIAVISARNPVHSVLFLILAFFNAAGLFVMLGAEFVAMILVIVYVGAVAVLFLFVVMMLDIDFSNLRKGIKSYIPVGLALGGVLLAELILLFKAAFGTGGFEIVKPDDGLTNAESLGRILYTEYIFAFQVSGLVLLVAMIGAIVLTLRTRPGVRRQNVADQVSRKAEDVMSVEKVTPRTGA